MKDLVLLGYITLDEDREYLVKKYSSLGKVPIYSQSIKWHNSFFSASSIACYPETCVIFKPEYSSSGINLQFLKGKGYLLDSYPSTIELIKDIPSLFIALNSEVDSVPLYCSTTPNSKYSIDYNTDRELPIIDSSCLAEWEKHHLLSPIDLDLEETWFPIIETYTFLGEVVGSLYIFYKHNRTILYFPEVRKYKRILRIIDRYTRSVKYDEPSREEKKEVVELSQELEENKEDLEELSKILVNKIMLGNGSVDLFIKDSTPCLVDIYPTRMNPLKYFLDPRVYHEKISSIFSQKLNNEEGWE
uniref:Uncharacterized protein n=1 Tax=viral metagenome TaxID=1070528 RepID=A0A6H1ZLN2_9ZZZZ